MKEPHIEAAGQRALELALAGAPGTTHKPPGTNKGKFTAIVTTPEGHPIQVEGWYVLDSSGHPVIESVYPKVTVDKVDPQIPAVPGSREGGGPARPATTPGQYGYGEDERE